MSIKPTFSGEVQFRRYSDTSTQGVQITLALHDRDALEPLVHKAGKRFMAVLVEIGEDEMPVQPPAEKVKIGPLCREAVGLCQMPEFQKWINGGDIPQPSEVRARARILELCGIESRKELDANEEAKAIFTNAIRLPFMRHMKTRPAA